MQSFNGFATFYFILELLALMATFRLRFFMHIGNLSDLAVVGVCTAMEIEGESRSELLPQYPLPLPFLHARCLCQHRHAGA